MHYSSDMPLSPSASGVNFVKQGSHLSERRTASTFIKALMWKNALLKRRHLTGTLFEICLPTIFILLLGLLKNLTDDVNVPTGWSDDTSMPGNDSLGMSYNLYQPAGSSISWVPTQLPKFNMHESSLTGLILTLGQQAIANGLNMDELSANNLAACTRGVAVLGAVSTDAASSHRVPDACANKVSPYKIGIAPDNTFTRSYFMQTMDVWYPRVSLQNGSASPQVPSLQESVRFFATSDALETYVSSKEYGTSVSHPRIYGAIVFDTIPSDDAIGSFSSIEYTLRLNSTASESGDMGHIPSTKETRVFPFQRKIKSDEYSRYATLVTRFVTCMPTWDASTKTTTGACQRPQATAKPSDELDARLLSTLDDDALVKVALESYATVGGSNGLSGGSPFSNLLASMPAASREALLKPLRQAPQPFLGASVAPFPIEGYTSSPFYDSIKDIFALLFVLAYLYMVSRVLVAFIQEKESRMREFMKILGVKEKTIIISWYITYTGILFVGAVLQALAGLFGLFANSSVVLIFLFFFLFGTSVLAFGFLVSALFSKSRSGAFMGMILFFVMYSVSTSFSEDTTEGTKAIASVLSPVALSFGVKVLATLESTGQGVSFDNMSTLNDNYRFTTALLALLFDTVLYTVLGLYFEKVVPKEWGTSLKWYFPVSPSYWLGRHAAHTKKVRKPPANSTLVDNVVVELDPNFEPVNGELREQERTGAALSVQGLHKVFAVPGDEKVAVKGMNLT
ncbi:hypothetical protein PybrP1_003113, partial [[Pythium] brassicae (nom. inval.)]